MVQLAFDASKVAPATGTPDPIPTAWYNAAMDESEMKATKDGTGAYLNARFNILDGQYQGRKVYALLNLKNLNPTAVEIAYKELSAICHAAGVIQCNDSAELHGRPMKIKVKLRPADKGYDASNVIAAYRNINDPSAVNAGEVAGAAHVVAPTQAPAFQMPAAQASAQAQPWASGAPAVQQPWASAPAPAAPPIVTAPVMPAAVAAPWSPPAGWTAHPSSPGWFYSGQEVLTEADLKAKFAAPAVPAVPAAPQVPAAPAASVPWTAPAGVAPASGPQTATPPWATPAA